MLKTIMEHSGSNNYKPSKIRKKVKDFLAALCKDWEKEYNIKREDILKVRDHFKIHMNFDKK